MNRIAISESHGLVRLHFPPNLSEAAFDAGLKEFVSLCQWHRRRGSHFAIVADCTTADAPNARIRKLMSTTFQENDATLRKVVVCWAVVMNSGLVRGVITALSWVYPPPMPFATHESISGAEAWCLHELSRKGPA